MTRQRLTPYLVLIVGVLFASTAAILVRYAQNEGVPSLTVAAGRMGFTAIMLLPIAFARSGSEIRRLSRGDMLAGVGAGFILSLHFVSWISSLEYTSVASSVALVTTNPIWIAIASWLFFRERLTRGLLFGLILTLTGSGLIILSGADASATDAYPNALLGNMLALLGAITVSGYFLIGRGLRRNLSTLTYIWLVYTSAAVILLVGMAVMGQSLFGLSPLAYLFLFLLAIGPQLLGHTAFNWALGHLSATFIAVAILGEPVGAALFAIVLFGETIDPTTVTGVLQLGGFALLMVGIYVAARAERSTPPPAPPVIARNELEPDL